MKKIDTKKVAKIGAIAGLSLGLILALLILANAFFENNYLEFRSPIQSPILIKKREIIIKEVIKEVEVEEVEEVEEVVMKATPTGTLIVHTQVEPGIYGKIKEYFGDDAVFVGEILARESGLNPTAVNSTSGAIGLFQRYPADTLLNQCPDLDVDCQMENGKEYIESRYGTPEKAWEFWKEQEKIHGNGWY